MYMGLFLRSDFAFCLSAFAFDVGFPLGAGFLPARKEEVVEKCFLHGVGREVGRVERMTAFSNDGAVAIAETRYEKGEDAEEA